MRKSNKHWGGYRKVVRLPLLTREKLFGARVSTSKYLFSVGLTGKTDPAGRQMEYNYDSQGRLIETCRFNEQGQRNLTGFHQYHLVNESN